MDLTDIHGIFLPTPADQPFFLSAHGTFSSIDHVAGQKKISSIKKE
jgi:hypothetical protein